MRSILPSTIIGLAVTLAPAQADAQTVTSTVLELPDKTIEVAGLKRWTPAMIQDSMDVYAPGDSLHSHACAATLRYELGFADAASIILRRQDGGTYAFVSVIEPQDSALVSPRDLPRDTTGSEAPWPELVEWSRAEPRVVQRAILARMTAHGAALTPSLSDGMEEDSALIRKVWDYVDTHQSETDAAAAQQQLATSPYLWDRFAAVAILSSFDPDDATWHALIGALREPDGMARVFANQVLSAFTRAVPRQVDWRPAAENLHAILNGGSLFDLHIVLDLLVRTGVDPALAGPLLGDGGHAVLMYAGAAHPSFRGVAHRFLRSISGDDHGRDIVEWTEWIDALSTRPFG